MRAQLGYLGNVIDDFEGAKSTATPSGGVWHLCALALSSLVNIGV